MIFGDERRFAKQLVASPNDKQVLCVSSPSTDANVGPGAYFNTVQDEKRNGWQGKSFSNRSPMTPSRNSQETSRADYIGGVLTSYGALASPVGRKDRVAVGPGHYEGDVLNSFSKNKPHRGGKTENGPSSSPTTPRFAFNQSLVLRDGVLFQSKENENNPIGPGYYAIPIENTLVRPSFNVRAQNNRPNSPGPNVYSSLRSSGSSVGSQRPRSASSGPRLGAKRNESY